MEIEIKDAYDCKDAGPQIVAKGRRHSLTVECYVPENTLPENIEEYILMELGAGGIGPDNPLFNGVGFEVRDVIHERDDGVNGFTIWNAKGEGCSPNERRGRTVHRRPGEPIV